MMLILLLTFVTFAVVALAMALGVIISGRSLRGSCGGPNCRCGTEGKPLGSCDYENGPSLPTHPS